MNARRTLVVILALGIGLSAGLTARAADIDNRIENSAKQTYNYRTYLKDDHIRIEAKDGVVTLTGTVATDSHRALAEDTVKGLPGVVRVDNQLEVEEPKPLAQSDDWISAKVKAALLFHRSVSAKTQVFVQDGVVTLKGEAANQAEKNLTTEYARDVEGVKDVSNEMTIAKPTKPVATLGEKIDDASITAQVKFVLLTNRATSALHTSVETNDGVVSLGGTAKNQAEIDLVTKLVNDVDGVKSVNNEMKIKE